MSSTLGRCAAVWMVVCLTGCAGNRSLIGLGRTTSPYEHYLDTLRRSGLDQTALGRDWAQAGEESLQKPVSAESPFSETGYLPPDTPLATAYRLDLRRGRRLVVDVTFESMQPGRFFVDLFEMLKEGPPQHVASLPVDATTLTYNVERDATYLLRFQPELLRGGRFTIAVRALSSLMFPVSGLTARAVQSSFGVARDAGTRDHEGIDVFAAKGTPVVAVTGGLARIDTNGLGGNVVWLREGITGRRFYYAHLDRWAMERTSFVRAGDVLGYVGSTGNARTTAPHLHFGIYEHGALDPLPFLQADDDVPPAPSADPSRLGEVVRVVTVRAALREGASKATPVRSQLEQGSVARVLGMSQSALRVALPDESVGYMDATAVTSTRAALRRRRLASGSVLREAPKANAPVVDILAGDLQVDVLGRSGRFELVRTPDGRVSWIDGG